MGGKVKSYLFDGIGPPSLLSISQGSRFTTTLKKGKGQTVNSSSNSVAVDFLTVKIINVTKLIYPLVKWNSMKLHIVTAK